MFLTLSFIIPHQTFIGLTYDLLAKYHHLYSHAGLQWILEWVGSHSQTGSLGMKLCQMRELWTTVAMQQSNVAK